MYSALFVHHDDTCSAFYWDWCLSELWLLFVTIIIIGQDCCEQVRNLTSPSLPHLPFPLCRIITSSQRGPWNMSHFNICIPCSLSFKMGQGVVDTLFMSVYVTAFGVLLFWKYLLCLYTSPLSLFFLFFPEQYLRLDHSCTTQSTVA